MRKIPASVDIETSGKLEITFRYFVKKEMIKPHKTGKLIITLSLIFIAVFSGSSLFAAEKYPQPRGAVNDFAGVIDAGYASRMEALSREVLQKTGTAVVVVTVASVGENEEVNMYANKLYKAWGIGKKGEDKGVLIFLAVKERKIRIETGYGVEGILPDGLVGEIRDKYVVPELKAGNYGKGLYNAVYACSAYIVKDAHVQLGGAQGANRQKTRAEKKWFNVIALIIIFVVIGLLLGTRTGRSMLPWILLLFMSGGGGRGSGGGGFSGGFGGFGGGGSGGGGAGGDY